MENSNVKNAWIHMPHMHCWKCSNCGKRIRYKNGVIGSPSFYKYCPFCGETKIIVYDLETDELKPVESEYKWIISIER